MVRPLAYDELIIHHECAQRGTTVALTMEGYRKQLQCRHRWFDEGESDGSVRWVCSNGCGAETHGDPEDFEPETPEDMNRRLGLT